MYPHPIYAKTSRKHVHVEIIQILFLLIHGLERNRICFQTILRKWWCACCACQRIPEHPEYDGVYVSHLRIQIIIQNFIRKSSVHIGLLATSHVFWLCIRSHSCSIFWIGSSSGPMVNKKAPSHCWFVNRITKKIIPNRIFGVGHQIYQLWLCNIYII